MAAYPKTVTLRADRRVCSNSLLTAHFGFVFVFVIVLIFSVLFYARDCLRKLNWSGVCLCICLRNIRMPRCLCICSDHRYLSGGLLYGPPVLVVGVSCFSLLIYGYKYFVMER